MKSGGAYFITIGMVAAFAATSVASQRARLSRAANGVIAHTVVAGKAPGAVGLPEAPPTSNSGEHPGCHCHHGKKAGRVATPDPDRTAASR